MGEVKTYGTTTIELLNEDIVDSPAKVLVNAANTRLWLGGGVAGAIRRVCGDEVQTECNLFGKITMGTVVVTGAGRHSTAQWIFHAAVADDDADLCSDLASVREALNQIVLKVQEKGVSSIAIPLLGAGVGGLDGRDVVREILKAFERHGRQSANPLHVIIPIKDPSEFDRIRTAFDAYTDLRTEQAEINRAAEELIRQLEQKMKRPSK
jgi:O-acetyl-ADP-ribose deacetylase (regulator of RNase III)